MQEHPLIEAAPSQERPGQGTGAQGITREVAPKQPSTNTAFLQLRTIELSNSFVSVLLAKLKRHKHTHMHIHTLSILSMISFPHIKHAGTPGAEDIWSYITPATTINEKPFNEAECDLQQESEKTVSIY